MTDPIERTARYQDDLARLLAALEPVERAEVLDGVREHIDAALAEVGHAPTDADVDRILGQLGSPGMVAEAALAERPDTPVPGPVASGVDVALARFSASLTGRWVPPVALLLLLVGGGLLLWGYPLLLIVIGILMVIGSPLWVGGEKLWATIALPLCSAMILGSFYVVIRVGVCIGGIGLNGIGFFVFAAASLVVLAVLWFRGARRAGRYRLETRGAAEQGQTS